MTILEIVLTGAVVGLLLVVAVLVVALKNRRRELVRKTGCVNEANVRAGRGDIELAQLRDAVLDLDVAMSKLEPASVAQYIRRQIVPLVVLAKRGQVTSRPLGEQSRRSQNGHNV